MADLLGVVARPYRIELEDSRRHKPENGAERVLIWALDRDNESHLWRVENFAVTCYIELPTYYFGRSLRWEESDVCNLHKHLTVIFGENSTILPYHHNHFVYMKNLYGYHPPPPARGKTTIELAKEKLRGHFPKLMLFFKSRDSMAAAKRRLFRPVKIYSNGGGVQGEFQFKVHEAEIGMICKLLAYRDFNYCSWITTTSPRVPDGKRISSCKHEYLVDYATINVVPEEICKGWATHPMMLGFDIESYSDNAKVFTNPLLDAHVVYLISVLTLRENDPHDNIIRYCLIYGDCYDIPPEKLANTKILRYTSEPALLLGFCELFVKCDPQVVVTYNGLGYDWWYIMMRLAKYGLDFPVMGKLLDRETTVERSEGWSSQAYGIINPDKVYIPGVDNYDLYIIIKRDYKRSSYGLSEVSKDMIGKDKHPIGYEEQFRKYECMREGMKFPKDSDEYHDAMREITDVVLYCIQDTELCFDLFRYLKLWVSSTVMANIMRVNMTDLYLRGQQLRCESQLYAACFKERIVLDSRPASPIPFVGGEVEAITETFDVDDINTDFEVLYDNCMCIDFQSLYPSIMIDQNICYTTYVDMWNRNHITKDMCNVIIVDCTEDYDPSAIDDDLDEEEKEELRNKHNYCENGKKGRYEFWFIKKQYYVGILPGLVDKLCKKRREVVEQLKLEKDPFMAILLDKQQLGLKISANSFFGFLGVLKNGKRPFREAAVSITRCGRTYIGSVGKELYAKYPGCLIVYKDTDSCMVQIKGVDSHRACNKMINEICAFVTSLFPGGDIIMKREWIGTILVIKKKKYCFMQANKDNLDVFEKDESGVKDKLNCKGLIPVRRDNCKLARDIYYNILYMVMHRAPYIEVISYLIQSLETMLQDHVDYKEFLITRSFKDSYKNINYPIKVFADELTKIGRPPQPGERLSYLIAKTTNFDDKLGMRMRLKEQYEESQLTDCSIAIDYLYYIEGILMNPVDQLISLVYRKETRKVCMLACKRTSRCKLVGMNKPVGYIVTRLRSGRNIDGLIDEVYQALTEEESTAIDFFSI